MSVNIASVKRGFLIFLMSLLSVSTIHAAENSGGTELSNLAGLASSVLGEKININTASTEMISKIPGIGPQLGEAITTYRELNGNFSAVKDLLNVDGMDGTLFEKIEPFLSI